MVGQIIIIIIAKCQCHQLQTALDEVGLKRKHLQNPTDKSFAEELRKIKKKSNRLVTEELHKKLKMPHFDHFP